MHFWGHYIMNLLENMDHELWESKNVIYCYTNKINGKRYVGQTINKLRKRHNQHQSSSYRKKNHDYNLPLHNAMRKYDINSFTLEILHIADEYSIDMLERYYIYFLDTLVKNNKGYNVSDGGNNANVFAGKTEEELREWKQKISKALKGKYTGEKNPNYGKRLSEERKKKLSELRKGKYMGEDNPNYGNRLSVEQRKRISKSRKGKYNGENHYRHASVVGVGIDDVLFYKYISEAKNDGFGVGAISACCTYYHDPETFLKKYKYPRKSYKGYIWYYKQDYDKLTGEEISIIQQRLEKEIKLSISLKNIVAVSVKNEEVLFFENARQAVREGFYSSAIHKCCRGELKTHKGYKWYYKEDYDKMIKETD